MSVSARPAAAIAERTTADGPLAPSAASLLLQLLLVLLVVRLFGIEEAQGLFAVMVLAAAGFVIHRRLPIDRRPAFFLAVSLASFPVAFWAQAAFLEGWTSEAACLFAASRTAWVFGLGSILIVAAHLPAPFPVRAILLAGLAGALVLWRSDELATLWPTLGSNLTAWKADGEAAFWAVLGSIFMFRLWIYLRETRRESKPAPWSQRLAYFFLLPNACFPFFPIVDYRRFRDGYRPGDSGDIAQRGLSWMLRGIVHLLLYRAIKIYLLPGPFDLIDLEYLALFLVTNYALYLRISGYFHIITGLLHLFGYDLPRTHDRYFLASSLSDIWRRINIYWKDFLTEHVFYPAFFTLRKLPRWAAVMGGVLVVFVATWLLHSWQAFWLLGDFPIAARDAILWLSAGSLVAINSLWQYRATKRGVRTSNEVTPRSALRLSLQVVATFLTVAFFWACWTIPQFPQLVAAVVATGGITARGLAVVGGTLVAMLTTGTLVQLLFDRLRRGGFEPSLRLEHSPTTCIATLSLLALIGLPGIHEQLGHEATQHIVAMQKDPVSAAEAGQRMEGYYEEIAGVDLQSEPLLVSTRRPSESGRTLYFDAVRERNDLLEKELIPGWTGEIDGIPFRVNRWGMRDDDVSRRKPPGTYRVAIIGSSTTMGLGVAADADFESIVEQRVNETIGTNSQHVEFLNFALGQYDSLHAAGVLREKAFAFDLDAVFLFVDQSEFRITNRLANASYLKYPLPYPCLEDVLDRAGVTEKTSWGTTGILLHKHIRTTIDCVNRGLVDDCRRRGVTPVWIYLPMPGFERESAGVGETLAALAHEVGFVVLDLSDRSDHRALKEVMADKYHANALGHRLIAERLYEALKTHPQALPPFDAPH